VNPLTQLASQATQTTGIFKGNLLTSDWG